MVEDLLSIARSDEGRHTNGEPLDVDVDVDEIVLVLEQLPKGTTPIGRKAAETAGRVVRHSSDEEASSQTRHGRAQ